MRRIVRAVRHFSDLAIAALFGVTFVALEVSAQEARPAPPAIRAAPPPYEVEEHPTPPPLGHRGFQLAVRTGVSIPTGLVAERIEMSKWVAAQVPIFVEVGAKPDPHVFVGGYLGYAFGGVTDTFELDDCASKTCSASSVHFGAQIQYHVRPDEWVDPWLGYGIGYEILYSDGENRLRRRGPEYARFMFGVDLRLTRSFGFGPFIDVTLSRFTDVKGDSQSTTDEREIKDTELHQWFTLGVRAVIPP